MTASIFCEAHDPAANPTFRSSSRDSTAAVAFAAAFAAAAAAAEAGATHNTIFLRPTGPFCSTFTKFEGNGPVGGRDGRSTLRSCYGAEINGVQDTMSYRATQEKPAARVRKSLVPWQFDLKGEATGPFLDSLPSKVPVGSLPV